MNLTLNYTVFGGMIAIIVIYLILKKFNVENYWRGVISFSLAMVGYGIYASSHWTSVDTLTIHIAVYSATATVASLIGMKRSQGQSKLTWVPKLFVLFFIALGIFNTGLLIVGTNGISDSVAKVILPEPENGDETTKVNTGFAGTVEHGEESAKTISSQLKQNHKLKNTLGWDINFTIGNTPKLYVNQPHKAILTIMSNQNSPIIQAKISVHLKRPGKNTIERTIELMPSTQAGFYETNVTFTEQGLWILDIQINKDNNKYHFEKEIKIES